MRNYSSITPEFILNGDCLAADTILNVTNADITPAVPFTLVLNPDTIKEEIVTVTAIDGLQFTVSRAEEGTNPAKDHLDGDKARHMITGRDLQEAQDHIANTTNPHGITISTLATKTYADAIGTTASSALSSHSSATTGVHGITDTAALATKNYADTAVSTHNADTTDVHGIVNTANLPNIVSALAGRTIYVQAAEPTSPVNGDIWFDLP